MTTHLIRSPSRPLLVLLWLGLATPSGADNTLPDQETYIANRLATTQSQIAAERQKIVARRQLVWPENASPALRRQLAEDATALGLPPERFRVRVQPKDPADTRSLTDGMSAFIYLAPSTLTRTADWRAFTMAHEWGHLNLDHAGDQLATLYRTAAAECFNCVKGKDPLDVAIQYGASHHKALHTISQRHELEADAWAVRYLAGLGRVVDYEVIFTAMHQPHGCLAIDELTHPSCQARVRNAYRVLATEYPHILTPAQKLRVFETGAIQVSLD